MSTVAPQRRRECPLRFLRNRRNPDPCRSWAGTVLLRFAVPLTTPEPCLPYLLSAGHADETKEVFMTFLSVIPRRGTRGTPVRWGMDLDRVFNDFLRGFEMPTTWGEGVSSFNPRLDVAETDKEVRITAD